MADSVAGAISEFLDFMPDTVTIYPWTGQTVTGAPDYSPTGTTYDAYIEMENHLAVDAKGQQVLARGWVFLGSNAVVGIKDKIVLPDGFVPSSPPIISVNLVSDEAGNHHTELEIG